MATAGPHPQTDAPAKSTLYCLHCDHQSRVDEDWNVRELAGQLRIVCPACGTIVATRRRDEDRSIPRPSS